MCLGNIVLAAIYIYVLGKYRERWTGIGWESWGPSKRETDGYEKDKEETKTEGGGEQRRW